MPHSKLYYTFLVSFSICFVFISLSPCAPQSRFSPWMYQAMVCEWLCLRLRKINSSAKRRISGSQICTIFQLCKLSILVGLAQRRRHRWSWRWRLTDTLSFCRRCRCCRRCHSILINQYHFAIRFCPYANRHRRVSECVCVHVNRCDRLYPIHDDIDVTTIMQTRAKAISDYLQIRFFFIIIEWTKMDWSVQVSVFASPIRCISNQANNWHHDRQILARQLTSNMLFLDQFIVSISISIDKYLKFTNLILSFFWTGP